MIANSNDVYQTYFKNFVDEIGSSIVYEQKIDDPYKAFWDIFYGLANELKYDDSVSQSDFNKILENNPDFISESFCHSYNSTFNLKKGLCRQFADRLMIELSRLNIPNGLIIINRTGEFQNHIANIYLDKDNLYYVADLTSAIHNPNSYKPINIFSFICHAMFKYKNSRPTFYVSFLKPDKKFTCMSLEQFLKLPKPSIIKA